MKHHEYQIYYGGFKKILKGVKICEQCKLIILKSNRKYMLSSTHNHGP